MFSIAKLEIEKRYKEKSISELRDKGIVTIGGIGSLRWDGNSELTFTPDPSLIRVLKQRT